MNRRETIRGLCLLLSSGVGSRSWAAQYDSVDRAMEDEIISSIQLELEILSQYSPDGGDRGDGLNIAAAGGRAGTVAKTPLEISDELDEAFISYGGNYSIPQSVIDAIPNIDTRYWSLPPANRIAPDWPDEYAAPDYAHLTQFDGDLSGAFEFSAATLQFLASRNGFDLADAQIVLFGLRGCAPGSADLQGWAPTHTLSLQTPDHVHPRCVLGAWNRENDQILIAPASTVPEAQSIHASTKSKGLGTSLLPTGLYHYRVGTHKASHPRRKQPGSFLIDQYNYLVLRSPNDLKYDPNQEYEVWTVGAAHNIHSAGSGRNIPRYYSAGCQVIPGYYSGSDREYSEGAWRGFRQSLGVVDASGTTTPPPPALRGRIPYVLFTGKEAALFDLQREDFLARYYRLRVGSSGDNVKKIQAELNQNFEFPRPLQSGSFDTMTAFGALRLQKDRIGEYVSPIVELS